MNRAIGGALAAPRAVPESVSPESVSMAARAGSRVAKNLEARSAVGVASIPALALALLLVAGVPCSAQDGDLLVRPFEDQVFVEGVQPFSEVVLFGVIRRVVGTIPSSERWVGTASDADGDGLVTVTLDAAVETDRSVWVVLDTKDMAWAISQPVIGGSPVASPAEATMTAGATQWVVPAGKIEVLAVRPSGGIVAAPTIWAASVWDGGSNDGDGLPNGSVAVKAQKLVFIGGGSSLAPPETFEAGDVLVAFQPESFQPFVARVTDQGPGGEI